MKTFKLRLIILLIILLSWGGTTAGALFYYSVLHRDKYLALGNRLALREGSYAAPRGRLLDRNGTPLAWTEKYFDLYLVNPQVEQVTHEVLIKEVREVVPDCEPETVDETTWLLKLNLSPLQMVGLERLLRSYPELKIRPRLERIVVDYPEIRKLIGLVVYDGEAMKGVSGVEKEYDRELAGTPGRYEVMLDRRRNWIPGTWKLLVSAAAGEDVHLKFSVDEIVGGGK